MDTASRAPGNLRGLACAREKRKSYSKCFFAVRPLFLRREPRLKRQSRLPQAIRSRQFFGGADRTDSRDRTLKLELSTYSNKNVLSSNSPIALAEFRRRLSCPARMLYFEA